MTRASGARRLLGIVALCASLTGCFGLQFPLDALSERGIGGAASDAGLRLAIYERWLGRGIIADTLFLAIWEGRVLVAGAVERPDTRATAIAAARQVEGVREVIDEVAVVPTYSLGEFARDLTIVQAVQSRLLLTRDISSVNFLVEAARSKVFLLGVARDEAERRRVIAVVRDVSGVREIADHILLRDDPRRRH